MLGRPRATAGCPEGSSSAGARPAASQAPAGWGSPARPGPPARLAGRSARGACSAAFGSSPTGGQIRQENVHHLDAGRLRPVLHFWLLGPLLAGTPRAWPSASERQKHFGFPARIGNENWERESGTIIRNRNREREPEPPLRKAPCQPLGVDLLSLQPRANRWTKAKLSNALFMPTA